MSRAWLITGCSSGIGRALAEHVLAIGERVAVTARNPAAVSDLVAPCPDTALALPLDVTDPRSIAAAVAAAEERFGQIDVLVNNAGYGYVASIEEGDETAVKAMFETNFFGALRMMKAVLPAMRARRSGTFLQISSLAGRIANPATGYYSSSKHALEAASEALSREVAGLGIKVCSIAPGLFRSDFSGRSLHANQSELADYAGSVAARIDLVKSVDGHQRGDPAKLAALVVAVADMPDPPPQMIAGPDAWAAVDERMRGVREAMERNRALSCGTDFTEA